MIDFQYLSKGLNALARAHRMSAMAGHLGGAVIAGYFIGEQRPGLDPRIGEKIERDLEKIIKGESVFGKRMTKNSPLADAELFEAFPNQKADETLIDSIAEALAKNIGRARSSGHNVIFASLAIRALREHPEFATPAVTAGISKLVSLFDKIHPGSGYYGKEKGRISGNKIKLPEDDGLPVYRTLDEMGRTVLDEVIGQDPAVHRQGYGGLVHVINHAAALVDLAQYGYPELLEAGLRSHRHHLRLWRNLPNVAGELGPVKVSEDTPHSAAYWASGKLAYDRALLTHRVKTMFGFDELAGAVEDKGKRRLAYDKLRYLM